MSVSHEKPLVSAHTSCMALVQAQGKIQVIQKELGRKIEACVKPAGYNANGCHCACKFNQDMLEIHKQNNTEKRRVEWTTHANLKLWFDLLRDFLVAKVFRWLPKEQEEPQGLELVLFSWQDEWVPNLEKSDLSLDHFDGKECGWKPIVKVLKSLLNRKEIHNKSSNRATLVSGCQFW